MPNFTRQDLAILMAPRQGPCVTLTMPTDRRRPGSDQHATRYANLVKVAGAALEKQRGRRDEVVMALLEQIETLGGPKLHPEGLASFWHHQKDGLAIFAAPDHFSMHRVPIALRDITVVADSFHVKPLLALLFDDQRYHLLTLTRNEVKVHEGTADSLEPLVVPGLPASMEEVLGKDTDPDRPNVTSHGGSAAGQAFMSYGKGSDDEKERLRKFFRAVAKVVEEQLSRPTGLPLVLAAVDYYHPLYREVAHDRHLVADGITQDPKPLSIEQLRKAAAVAFEPMRRERLRRVTEEFGTARSHGQGSNELAEVAVAAVQGRVKRLMLEERRRVWGRIDRTSGGVTLAAEPGRPGDVDLLDELAELTVLGGGDVHILPRESMPAASPVAATYRY